MTIGITRAVCAARTAVGFDAAITGFARIAAILAVAFGAAISGVALGAPISDGADFERASDLYHRTEYRDSLDVLLHAQPKNAQEFQLIGQDYFQLAEYKKATDALERASAMDRDNPRILLWLGRAYGRRAETASPFTAPGYASKARQMLERSVALDPSSKEATGDLLDYYLDAPGFLGGGMQKAEALAQVIAKTDPAEGHYAEAVIAEKRKEFGAAEQHLRRAAEVAPRQVSRVVALATYLAKHGRIAESDAMFDRAAKMAPNDPRILFERASAYVENRRNLPQARELLQRYLESPLTPDDPPRQDAEALLRKIG